jgi:uncharacterized membrane protein YphA (DoxX/SURF4 family)
VRLAGRLVLALVWIYNGLWCKLLAQCPQHREIVESLPGALGQAAGPLLLAIGAVETLLALWVASGWKPRLAAAAQTALLVPMNAVGLIGGRERIPDASGLILQNVVFLTLVWTVALGAPRDDGSK